MTIVIAHCPILSRLFPLLPTSSHKKTISNKETLAVNPHEWGFCFVEGKIDFSVLIMVGYIQHG